MRKIFFIYILIAVCFGCSGDDDSTVSSLPDFNPITINTNESVTIDLDHAVCSGKTSIALDAANAANYKYGICYSLTPQPLITDNIGQSLSNNSDTGAFTTKLNLLEPGSTYYARAYITNGETVKYGDQIIFTVPQIIESLGTWAITATDFKLGASITAAGNSEITASGFCYSMSPNPTVSNSEVVYETNSVRNFYSVNTTPSNLIPTQTYYARSFVISEGRTFYSNELSTKMAGYIGPSGGIVCYDAGSLVGMSNDHFKKWRYIEVAPSTINYNGTNDYFWGCSGYYIGLDFNLGSGASNTDIMARCEIPNTASSICKSAVIAGNSDWYLPNRAELEVIYKLKLAGLVNFNQNYFASEQVDNYYAYGFSFSNGYLMHVDKPDRASGAAILPIRYYE